MTRRFYNLIVIVFGIILLSTCKEEDGMTGPWQRVSSLPAGFRTHHSFGFSINGVGYLVTGDTGTPRKDFYTYNPELDQWTKLGDYPGPARSYGIGDVWDGKAYLGFGSDASGNRLNDLWVFNSGNGQWSQLASCPGEPRQHPTLVAHQGKIYVGMGNAATNLKDWWVYDITSDTWEQRTDFPEAPRHHPYQFAIGDYVYAGLGHGAGIYKNWFRYDPVGDAWTAMADIPGEGRVAGTQFSYNGYGYVLSGDGDDHRTMETGEFWKYDPVANEWEQLPPHPGNSRWAPASFIIDGEVYLINGTIYDGHHLNFQEEVYKYRLEP